MVVVMFIHAGNYHWLFRKRNPLKAKKLWTLERHWPCCVHPKKLKTTRVCVCVCVCVCVSGALNILILGSHWGESSRALGGCVRLSRHFPARWIFKLKVSFPSLGSPETRSQKMMWRQKGALYVHVTWIISPERNFNKSIWNKLFR